MSLPAPALALQLERAARRLGDRLAQLEARLEQDDAATWTAYSETVQALAVVLPAIAPERRGALLTTAQMAERLVIAPKTLLRRRKRGQVRPAVELGERGRAALRWRGDEVAQ